MISSLTDIEELVLHCDSEESKEHIKEAILCYKAGAYRAAIVTTWVAVVFNLIADVTQS